MPAETFLAFQSFLTNISLLCYNLFFGDFFFLIRNSADSDMMEGFQA